MGHVSEMGRQGVIQGGCLGQQEPDKKGQERGASPFDGASKCGAVISGPEPKPDA